MDMATSIKILTLVAAGLWSVSTLAQTGTAPPGIVKQRSAPSIYRFSLGDAQITALSDGTVPIDLHQLLRGAPTAIIDALLARSFLDNPVEASINAYLIELGGRRILVDAGAGDLFGPGNGGRIPEALIAAGTTPEAITDILITHVHSDHSGGLVRGGRMIFPNAVVHAGGPDIRFFSNADQAGRNGYDKRYWAETAVTLKPYIEAGRTRAFDHAGEILPGIYAELHPGHTPGSAFYTLTSKGRSIVFVGDVIHVGAVQFPRPDVTITFDFDQNRARAARGEAFARFGRDRTLIAAPHLPFPGVGHVAPEGSGYRWYPVEHADRAASSVGLKL
jgi:glyoxylase-like metal-dependent hydrolase (beta-lactamase superfamily II)